MPPVLYDEHIVPTMNNFITYYIFFTTMSILMNVTRFLFDHYFLPENHDMQMKVLEQRIQLQESIVEELIRHLKLVRETVSMEKDDNDVEEDKKSN